MTDPTRKNRWSMSPMKVWVSKYALTKGVYEAEVRDCGTGTVNDTSKWGGFCYYGEGQEWHRTREEALTRAEKMRVAKITALHKQISKLESLDFSK